MDDNLILNFIRLVRNGRTSTRGSEEFNFGDLKMLDSGPYLTNDKLRDYTAKRKLMSQISLIVYIKGVVVEIWKFQDFRTTSPNATQTSAICSEQGIIISEQQEVSLKMLVRVIFAYLRIHEIFVEIMNTSMEDISLQLMLEPNELPHLELDACEKKIWAVEGLISIKMTYNTLWRLSFHKPAAPIPVVVATSINNPNTHNIIINRGSRVSATASWGGGVPSNTTTTTNNNINNNINNNNNNNNMTTGTVSSGGGPQGSESAGSGRSMPTPHFAPNYIPSSIGSGLMSASLKWSKSPTFGPSELFLPHATTTTTATTNIHDSLSYFKTPTLGAARGARTPAVKGYTFASVPTFAAAAGMDIVSEEESESMMTADSLHKLLEICDSATLKEEHVDLYDVLDILDKPPLDL